MRLATALHPPLRHKLLAAAVIVSLGSIWAVTGGGGFGGPAETLPDQASSHAASVVTVSLPPATASQPQSVGNDETAHRRMMMLMLIDRVRETGLFGRMAQ